MRVTRVSGDPVGAVSERRTPGQGNVGILRAEPSVRVLPSALRYSAFGSAGVLHQPPVLPKAPGHQVETLGVSQCKGDTFPSDAIAAPVIRFFRTCLKLESL